jgi:nucleoside-diphosphate-sugar epimerase
MKIFDGNLIPDMVLSALENKDITLTGDEETRISLAFVSDIVDGLVRLMATPIDVTLLNLGSDADQRLVSVAQKIIEITGSASRIRFEPPGPYATEAPLPDIARAREILGWIPMVRLDDGLRRMIEYAKSHRHLITF